MGALPVHSHAVRQLPIQGLAGAYASDTPERGPDSLAGFLGYLWAGCLGTTQNEGCFCLPRCSATVLAAYGAGGFSCRVHLSQAVTRKRPRLSSGRRQITVLELPFWIFEFRIKAWRLARKSQWAGRAKFAVPPERPESLGSNSPPRKPWQYRRATRPESSG